MRRILAAVVMAFLAAAGVGAGHGSARAGESRSEGQALFDLSARFAQPPRVGEDAELQFTVWDFQHDPRDTVDLFCRVDIPEGWTLVKGAREFRKRLSDGDTGWSIVLRPTKPGKSQVREALRIDRGRSWFDEAEYTEVVDLTPESCAVSPRRASRLETVRNGRRYRFAGLHLVPIDRPEAFTEDDLGSRARISTRTVADCTDCTDADPTEVAWDLIVGEDGRIVDAKLGSGIDARGRAARLTRVALDNWTFQPARAGGRSVRDWLEVSVRLSRR